MMCSSAACVLRSAHLVALGLIEGRSNHQRCSSIIGHRLIYVLSAGAGPVYTMLLTAKGKYLHDLFAYRIPGAP
jgi:hypothetical protein